MRTKHRCPAVAQAVDPVESDGRLGIAASTAHADLVRCRINRLRYIDRITGEPIRRFELAAPGEMPATPPAPTSASPRNDTAAAGGWTRY